MLRERILCCLLINKQMAVKFNKILTFTLHFLNVQFKEANVVNLWARALAEFIYNLIIRETGEIKQKLIFKRCTR